LHFVLLFPREGMWPACAGSCAGFENRGENQANTFCI
jgi:hypothetical protein